jgi:hypothetical protein
LGKNERIFSWFILIIIVVTSSYPFTESEAAQIKSDWVKTYGIGRTAYARQTKDGGFIVAGVTDAGSYLIKTDFYGAQLWKKTWDTQYGFNDVQQTSDGGYIICGSWSGNQGLLMKTTSRGETSWENHYWVLDMGLYFELNSVQQTSDGGYVAGGLRAKPPQEIEEGLIVKTDATGKNQWTYTESESINSISQTTDGGYISTGVYDLWPPESDHIYYVGLCKRDSAGNIEWDVELSKTGSATSVQQMEDGGYIISCNGFANLVKTNSIGSIEWLKTYRDFKISAMD